MNKCLTAIKDIHGNNYTDRLSDLRIYMKSGEDPKGIGMNE